MESGFAVLKSGLLWLAVATIGFGLGVVFQRQVGVGPLLDRLGLRTMGGGAKALPRASALGLLEIPAGSVVLLGDSLLDFQEWHEVFGSSKVLNRGVSGAKAVELVGIVDLASAKAVFVLAGINDLGAGASEDEFSEDYRALLASMPKGARIYAIGLPAAPRHSGRGVDRSQIIRRNELIRSAAEGVGGVYIDIFEVTSRLGASGFHEDGLHFSMMGYRAVAEVLRPYVEAELAAKG